MRSAKPVTTCRDGAETSRLSLGAAWGARRSVRGAGRDRIVEAAARFVGSKAPLGVPRARGFKSSCANWPFSLAIFN